MTFSSYLSFASLYEVEQREKERYLMATSSRGVLRRDSSSSNSSSSTTSSARVHFLGDRDSNSSSASLSSSTSSLASVYASHSARLHSSSKHYSTADGSLPHASCPYDRCSSMKTCSKCRDHIDEQDLSLKRFSR
ncbi:unnamed protein product [Parajaminaea phylloscopi]